MPALSNQRIQIGKEGEDFVATWLQEQGYTICAANYRYAGGEIDLIAKKNEILAFVEVKNRRSHYFNLSEVITRSKQRKITHVARRYIVEYGMSSYVYRFDVALIEGIGKNRNISYIENAFTDEWIFK